MKKSVTTLYQNTDLNLSVYISTSSFTSTLPKSPRLLEKLYVKRGALVVSITLNQEDTLVTTLRLISIALATYPLYIKIASYVRSPRILNTSVRLITAILKKRYMRMPLSLLIPTIACSALNPLKSFQAGRLNYYFSPNVMAFLGSMLRTQLAFIACTTPPKTS